MRHSWPSIVSLDHKMRRSSLILALALVLAVASPAFATGGKLTTYTEYGIGIKRTAQWHARRRWICV